MKKGNFDATGEKKFSEVGNQALSLKSMTSYILGDLDISGDDEKDNDENSDFNSFEISSNSSARSALSERNESSSKKLPPLHK